MKTILGLLLTLWVFSAAGQSGAWWTAYKQQNGIAPGWNYNDWVNAGCPRGGGGGSSGLSAAELEELQREQEARQQDQQGVNAYNQGDYASAIDAFQKAVENNPNDPTIKKHLADAQQTQQDLLEQQAQSAKAKLQFQQQKIEALNGMKGVDFDNSDGGGTGLKGIGSTDPGLKGINDAGSSDAGDAVDLRGTSTTVVDPARVNGTSPSLATMDPSDADKALMKHQWEISIDPRYLDDPEVQQHIRDLWNAARSDDDTANDKLKGILADQFKAAGQTPQQIANFFATFDAIQTGKGPVPQEWRKASQLANNLDDAGGSLPPTGAASSTPQPQYYNQLAKDIPQAESITANALYMGSGTQTEDDCVLYAIANGAQVPVGQVRDEFTKTVNNLGMDPVAERSNPETIVAEPQKGGRGGLNPAEELLVAESFGTVIPVPTDSYAKAIASTGRPVITTVGVNQNGDAHKVAVTGVYRTNDGKIYYAVMDSNLGKDYNNSTAYIEKSSFEAHVLTGGFVVVPNDHN